MFKDKLMLRYKKKDQNPNVGGLGLGFKEKTGRSSAASAPVQSSPPVSQPARGPATDRLSAMKAAFRAQYMNQVR